MIGFSISNMCKSNLIAIFVLVTLGLVSANAMSFDCPGKQTQNPNELTYQIAASDRNHSRGSCEFSSVPQLDCCEKAEFSVVGSLQRLETEFELSPLAHDLPWPAQSLISKRRIFPHYGSRWANHGPTKKVYLTTLRLRI